MVCVLFLKKMLELDSRNKQEKKSFSHSKKGKYAIDHFEGLRNAGLLKILKVIIKKNFFTFVFLFSFLTSLSFPHNNKKFKIQFQF